MNKLLGIFRSSKSGDTLIYISVLALAIAGIVMIGSASIGGASSYGVVWSVRNMLVQAGYVGLGILLMTFFTRLFSIRWLTYRSCMIVYFFMLGLMCVCRFWNIKGAYAWIKLPFGFTIQPAEFMKIAMICILAYFLTQVDKSFIKPNFKTLAQKENFYKQKFMQSLAKPLGLLLLACFVGVVVQNDLGTTVILLSICGSLFFVTPNTYYKKYKKMFFIAATGAIIIGLLLIVLGVLEAYQMDRIASWLDPLADPYVSSYQLVNALISFSNGTLFGAGLGGSTQKFGYIPEAHNDFIGAIVYEELGILGLMLIVIPFCIIIFRFLKYSQIIENDTGRLILFGIATYFFMHLLINLGGISGLIPMTGVPLLLISAGGSSTISAFCAIGVGQAVIRDHNRKNL